MNKIITLIVGMLILSGCATFAERIAEEESESILRIKMQENRNIYNLIQKKSCEELGLYWDVNVYQYIYCKYKD